jgi:DNA polymerase-3 subunit epsilon
MIPFLHRQKLPPFCQAWQDSANRRPARKTAADRIRFVVLDCETSGFKVGTDRILSLAAFEITKDRIDIAGSRKWIVYQPQVRLNQATAVHGILPEEIRQGTPEQTVIPDLLPMLGGAVLVGHHVRFDAAMLNDLLMRHYKIRFRNRLIDTAHMAMNELTAFHKTGYANQRPPSLDEVCAQLDLPLIARHTAEGDAFLTAEVFLMLSGQIRKRLGRPLRAGDLPIRKF